MAGNEEKEKGSSFGKESQPFPTHVQRIGNLSGQSTTPSAPLTAHGDGAGDGDEGGSKANNNNNNPQQHSSAGGGNSNTNSTTNLQPFSNVSTRVDRLLRERQMRRSQSMGTLLTAGKPNSLSPNATNATGTVAGGGRERALSHNRTLKEQEHQNQRGERGNKLDSYPSDSDMLRSQDKPTGSSPSPMRGETDNRGGDRDRQFAQLRSQSSSPAEALGQQRHKSRRQSDSESEMMARLALTNQQMQMGSIPSISNQSKQVANKSPIQVNPFPSSVTGGGGGGGGLGSRSDSLGFHGAGGGARGSAPELLGDWRNLSADKLVLMGQENVNNVITPLNQGVGVNPSHHRHPTNNVITPSHLREVQSLSSMSAAGGETQRLLVVANRLPLSAFKGIGGDWKLQVSAGGLVSALTSVEGFKMTWVGWPGQVIEEKERESLSEAFKAKDCCPVYLDEQTTDLFYNGYCNSVLWQLFHYIALQPETELFESQTVHHQYEAYKRANEEFMTAVMSQYQEGDIVWVHDYHLMLLPAMLKEEMPNMKVGWFLHTPFPSSEIFRTLPQRDDILTGVLRADLVGFHTYDYARHFVSSCCRILGLEGTLDGIENVHQGTITRVAVFPIGIDPERWISELDTPGVQARILEMRRQFSGRKVLLGVDRLDMVKGIPQKLLAFEKFLEDNPEWRNHVLLVQIAIPSRKDVPEYQKLTSIVHEMVGRINGRFGSLTQNPIHFLDCSLDFHQLCALYAVTDVLVVSSLRDGMNLVSYEFVACQSKDFPGVLVLSEFAGAAQSLGAGAILINPYNATELSQSIAYALKMGDSERQQRHRQNFMHVKVHTAQAWGETFISELHDTHVEAALRTMHIPPKLDIQGVCDAYKVSKSRLIVMGYNATLTTSAPAQSNHHRQFDQIRTLTQISEEVKTLLNDIASQPDTEVLVVSGSERFKLERIFDGINVWLAAENGVFLKPPFKGWELVVENINLEWMESVQVVFDYFCERTPRSYVDTRETSLVWNCKYADIDFGRNQMRDMLQHLWTGPISNAQVEILRGAKSVEARPLGVTKGGAVQRIMEVIAQATDLKPEFIFCAGHFMHRDEDIFAYFDKPTEGIEGKNAKEEIPNSPRYTQGMNIHEDNTRVTDNLTLFDIFGSPKHIFTCTVGRKHSLAKKHLKSSAEIAILLKTFV